MKTLLKALVVVALGFHSWGIATSTLAAQKQVDVVEMARTKWIDLLSHELPQASKLETAEAIMKKCGFRDKARLRLGGTGRWDLYFLVDDYHLVRIEFDRFDKTIKPPSVEKAGKWLKGPDGELFAFPHLAP